MLFYTIGDPTGIRTRVTAVKGRCLRPLDHGAGWSGWRDSNPRPLAPKASALAKLRYIPLNLTNRIIAYPEKRVKLYAWKIDKKMSSACAGRGEIELTKAE